MHQLRRIFLCLLLTLCLQGARAAELYTFPEGITARDLQLVDLAGRPHRLEDYRGKVVLINFWASWCTPCIAEMPALLRLENALRERGFRILAVNFKESKATVWKFYNMLGLDFVTLLDGTGEASGEWGVEILPTSFLVDADGKLRYRVRGVVEWDGAEMRALIDPLLSGASAVKLNTAAVQVNP